MVCAVSAISLLIWLTREREPKYQGKPLSYWVVMCEQENFGRYVGVATGHEAAAAIRRIGTNALPCLLEWTAFEPSRTGARLWAGRLLLELPFVPNDSGIARWARYDREGTLAAAATVAFGSLGTNAEPAIPELVRRMNVTNSRIAPTAIRALGCIGAPAAPVLLAELANTNAPNRYMVARQCGFTPYLATNDSRFVTQLLACLGASDPMVENQAAFALCQIAKKFSPQPDMVVPAIMEELPQSQNLLTAGYLLNTLFAYGPEARRAVPVLQRMLNAPNEADRTRATNALLQIAPEVLTNAPSR
jgi:hypothetical protein